MTQALLDAPVSVAAPAAPAAVRNPEILRQLNDAIAERNLSQRQFARMIATSDSYLSNYRTNADFPYAPAVESAFQQWLDKQPVAAALKIEKNERFLATRPAEKTMQALERIRATGECGLIYGRGGVGKTCGRREYVAKYPKTTFVFQCLQLTGCRERWAVERFLIASAGLRKVNGKKPTGADAFEKFSESDGAYFFIFEDAHLLHPDALDLIGMFSDHGKTACALVGNHELLDLIHARADQTYRRYGLRQEIKATFKTRADAKSLTDGYPRDTIREFVQQWIDNPSPEFLDLAVQIAAGRGHLGRLEKAVRHVTKLLPKKTDILALQSVLIKLGGLQ